MNDLCQYESHAEGRAWCPACGHARDIPTGLTAAQLYRRCPAKSPAPAPSGDVSACLHRGQVLREVSCVTCSKTQLTLPIYACAVHGECANTARRRKELTGIKLCAGCAEKKPVEPALPNLLQAAANYGQHLMIDFGAGRPRRSAERIAELFNLHCRVCKLYNSVEQCCSVCRCPVSATEPEDNLLAWAALGCSAPEPRWLPDVETTITPSLPPSVSLSRAGDGQTERPREGENMSQTVRLQFRHGLGDAVTFAHSIPLYLRRGHKIEVDCDPRHAPIFRAAGASIIPLFSRGCAVHDYAQRGGVNKVRFNLARPPMPAIGEPLKSDELWQELCTVDLRAAFTAEISDAVRQEVNDFLSKLPRPIALLHAKGREPTDARSLTPGDAQTVVAELLERDFSVVLLDWIGDQPTLDHFRSRNLARDWKPADVPTLVELIRQADIFLGVDSGPLHCCRLTDTPAIGLWSHHQPAHYALPRAKTLHFVPPSQCVTTVANRIEWQLVESSPSPSFVVDCALALNAGRRPAEVQLDQFLSFTRSCANGGYCDRHKSFSVALDKLRNFEVIEDRAATIVETGTIRSPEDWAGAGYSTYLFAAFTRIYGGRVWSVDLDKRHCAFARQALAPFASEQVRVVEKNSLEFLQSAKQWGIESIDLFYADSLDTDQPGHAEHCRQEVQLAVPLISPRGLVLIDDTWTHKNNFRGKGALAVPWLLDHGWRIVYAGYQVLLERQARSGLLP